MCPIIDGDEEIRSLLDETQNPGQNTKAGPDRFETIRGQIVDNAQGKCLETQMSGSLGSRFRITLWFRVFVMCISDLLQEATKHSLRGRMDGRANGRTSVAFMIYFGMRQ